MTCVAPKSFDNRVIKSSADKFTLQNRIYDVLNSLHGEAPIVHIVRSRDMDTNQTIQTANHLFGENNNYLVLREFRRKEERVWSTWLRLAT